MPGDDLTPGQVAELLQVDASTLRRWARAFKVHLSEQATGKRRRYSSADLAVLGRARDLLRAGKSPKEVAGLLAWVERDEATVSTSLAVASVTLPAMVADLAAAQEALRAALGLLGELRANQEEQGAKLAALEAQLAAWQALPWWRRILGRPPA